MHPWPNDSRGRGDTRIPSVSSGGSPRAFRPAQRSLPRSWTATSSGLDCGCGALKVLWEWSTSSARRSGTIRANPATVRLTNVYLSEDEYDALLVLPAAELHKSRSRTEWAGKTVAIDRFQGRLDGLLLAEVELSPAESFLPAPPWATEDVTNDDRFSGGALAFATDEAITELLQAVTHRRSSSSPLA
jgi:hypothetical protein